MKIAARLLAFFFLGIAAIHIVLTILQFAILWRSMVPFIAGPITQSIALLILVSAIQLLLQISGEHKFGYLSVGLALVIVGLIMAATRYRLAPVSTRGYAMIGLLTLITEFCLSQLTSYLGGCFSKKLRIVAGIALLVAAWLIPTTLIAMFSYGE